MDRAPEPVRHAAVPRRIWGATALSALGRQWNALCTVAALALLARTLPLDQFGHLAFYLAALAWLEVLVDGASSTVVVQRGAGGEAALARALDAGRWWRRRTAVAAALLLTGGALIGGDPAAPWVALAALGTLARIPELDAVVFQRDIAWGGPVLLRAASATLRLGVLWALTRAGVTTFGPYLAAHAGVLAAGHLALARVARPRLPAPLVASRQERSAFLRTAVPLALTGLAQQAYFHVDNGLVLAWCGAEELARYGAAVRVFAWLTFFPAFASTSALPWLARRTGGADLTRAAARLAAVLVTGGSVVAGLLWWSAPALLERAFGTPFVAAAPSLRWLALALLCVCAGAPFLTAVVAAGRTRAALTIASAALALNLALGRAWIPTHGASGAALATAATEGLVLLSSVVLLLRARARSLPRPHPGPQHA
jgi:O-antigen/teichoic acid export membrane protein